MPFSILFFITGLSSRLDAQTIDRITVSASFERTPLKEALNQLSSTYDIRFFYPNNLTLDQEVSAEFEEEILPAVLDRLLSGTNLGFLIYRGQAAIIGPAEIIGRNYDAEFYRSLEETLSAGDQSGEEEAITIGTIETLSPDGKARITGLIADAESGDPIIGATVFFPALSLGAATDEKGRFSLEIPTGSHEMRIQYVGYQEKEETLIVYNSGEIALDLRKEAVELQEVIVEAEAPDANVANTQIGVTRLDVKMIRELPSFMGESDVIRSLLLQPGVSTVGEGAGGFNVRGGNVDQNLLVQGNTFLFNATHALGFFSTFNTDLVKEATLYKSIIPAQYGGRLASVLDVEMQEGSTEKFGFKGGISPVTGRLSFDGPVIKNRSSFIAGTRFAYSDWILQLSKVPEVRQSRASFYDINLGYSHLINEKNRLTLSGYRSYDRFRYSDDFGFEYATTSGELLLRSIFNEQWFSSFSAVYSQYESNQDDLQGSDAAIFNNSVSYAKVKEQLSFIPDKDLALEMGLAGIFYRVEPGSLEPIDENSTVEEKTLAREQGLETALFANAEWTVVPAFSVSAGLRFNFYAYIGPQTVFLYEPGQPPSESTITGTRDYGKGDIIASYISPEPRLSLRYRFGPSSSLKAGYSRTAQFINQISNADAPTPTSLWQLSTSYIKPQRSHNFSTGFFKNFNNNGWESSAEVYYRYIDELFDYKNFADLNANEHLETELLPGTGRAYGLELNLKRPAGTINGWVSYTLSRTERQVEGLNQGDWYPANFDKTHDLSVVLNIEFNRRNRLSVNFNYQTGRPTTAPVGSYRLGNGFIVPDYTERNQLRIPAYHRLDLAYTIGQGYNKQKKFKTSWTFSIYNVYGRRNPYSVYFIQQPFQPPSAQRLSILGSIFPSITFNFELL